MTVSATEPKSAPVEKPKVYLLTPAEAAELLHTTKGVLGVWRCHRSRSLRFTRIGRKIFYRPQDIERFIEQGGVEGDEPKLKPLRVVKKRKR